MQRKLFAAGLSLNTCKGALQSVWASLWKAAGTEGLVTGKPHSELKWPKAEPEPDPFSAKERDAIIAYFQRHQPQYMPLVGSVWLAGMRPSEACGLRWGDIDLDTGDVTIARAIASREQTRGKTRKSLRQIRVSPRLLAIYRNAKPSWAEGSALCVMSRFHQPVDSSQFGRYHFRACCDALNLRYRGFYHGRHTFISLALMDGANPVEISAFCAVTLATMQRHYWKYMGAVHDPVESARKRDVARLSMPRAQKTEKRAHGG